MKTYLHQFLTRTGKFSTKNDVISAIRKEEISVDGKTITQPNYQFNANKRVCWKRRELTIHDQKVYIILNKPEEYLSSRLSPQDKKLGKKSVFDLIDLDERTKNTLSCVGRLDENTTGLLILTNDGKLNTAITQPKNKIPKTYYAHLEKELTPAQEEQIRTGVTITLEENGKKTRHKTCPATIISHGKAATITLFEGKKREVRRIFESVENKIISLSRIAIGNLSLYTLNLPKGKWAYLDEKSISTLRNASACARSNR
ncbi:MAG: pseudouridine synthase [Nanoarchaeota archaeon]